MAEEKVRVFINGIHLAVLDRDLVIEFRHRFQIINFVAWAKQQAYDEYDIELEGPNDVAALRTAVKAEHYGNIGNWLTSIMRSELAAKKEG